MKLEITLDLDAAVASALAPEKLAPILDKHIGDAITAAIREATGYRSKFSEALTEQMRAVLPHGLAVRDVAKFQHVLNKSLSELVGTMNSAAVSLALRKATQTALPEIPPTMKLSELLEAAREGFHKQAHEAFYALWEPSEYSDGGGHLYLDSDSSSGTRSYGSRSPDKYSASIRVAVSKDGAVYSMKLDGKQITPASLPNVVGHFESILLCMYFGRTCLEIDIDADDVECAAAGNSD